MSLRGSDENKKLNELEHIIKSSNIELYKKFGHGNPRLMDWLDKIAADEKKYNLEELQKALEGKEEDYIREYLAEIMAKAEGSEFWQFLQMAAVYRLPVLADAFEKFGGKKLLEKGVDLTLFEKEAVLGANVVLTMSTKIIDVTGDEPKITKGLMLYLFINISAIKNMCL